MPKVPTPIAVVAWLALAAGVVMMFVGAYQIGITWDEKTNMLSLQEFFNQGWNITADALIDGRPNPAYIWGTYVYGPVSLLFTHLISSLAGADSWGRVSFDAHAYAIRHLGGAFIGLLGIVAAAFTVRVITRSWRWAILGGAMLAVIPMWVGHSMMNIKDAPVGTGYSIATLGLVLVMRDDYLTRRSVRILGLFAVFAGAFLAAGTRAAAGVPIAGSAVVVCVVWWLLARRDGDRPGPSALRGGLRRLVETGLALVGTYLALVALYPNVWSNPVTLGYQAVVVSARFPFAEPIKFAGQWAGQPLPFTYLPAWFAAQLPLLVLVGSIGFILFWVWQVLRGLLGRIPSPSREVLAMSAAVVAQALLVPVMAVLGRATMYNGVRQFLFVVPAMAILATLGIWLLAQRLERPDGSRFVRGAVWTLVGIGLVAPTVSQLRLFPYNYVYFNAAASVVPIDDNWSTDYWRASSRELMQRLPADGAVSCAYEQASKGELWPCANEPMFQPYVGERGTAAIPGTLEPGQYWVVRENQGRTTIPDGCVLHDAITRRLFWQTITIGQIMACDAGAVIPPNGELKQ